METLLHETHKNPNPVGYDHLPGPEPFSPGSPDDIEHREWLQALDQGHSHLSKACGTYKTDRIDPSEDVSTVSLLKRDERQTVGTIDRCPRAIRRWIKVSAGRTIGVWLPCASRTCRFCKSSIDERDAARLSHSLGAGKIYLDRVPVDQWNKIRARARDGGVVAVKMGSNAAHDLLDVVSSGPITADSRPIGMARLVDLVTHRPTAAPPITPDEAIAFENGQLKQVEKTRGRVTVHMTGVGLITVREWEERAKKTDQVKAITAEMHHTITQDDVKLAADALGIPYTQTGPDALTLEADWDDPRMVGLRHYTRNPRGSAGTWEHMLLETEIRQGVLLDEPPPIEVYEEAVA